MISEIEDIAYDLTLIYISRTESDRDIVLR